MNPSLRALEKKLDEVFVKQAPPLPRNVKKALVEYLPWINLVLGLLALLALYGLWHWAHLVNNGFVDYANSVSAGYGGPMVTTDRMSIGLWLGFILLVMEAILYIAAFPGTRARKKSGWDLLFYAMLVNVVYGVAVLFTSYGSIGSLISTIIGSGIGLYLLFQIRSSYSKTPVTRKLD